MDGRAESKDGAEEEKIYYNQYVIPGRKDPKAAQALQDFKASGEGNTSLILVLIIVLGFILVALIGRYLYQRFITDSLHSNSEANFWTKKTMGNYKNHPKLQEAIRKKQAELEG